MISMGLQDNILFKRIVFNWYEYDYKPRNSRRLELPLQEDKNKINFFAKFDNGADGRAKFEICKQTLKIDYIQVGECITPEMALAAIIEIISKIDSDVSDRILNWNRKNNFKLSRYTGRSGAEDIELRDMNYKILSDLHISCAGKINHGLSGFIPDILLLLSQAVSNYYKKDVFIKVISNQYYKNDVFDINQFINTVTKSVQDENNDFEKVYAEICEDYIDNQYHDFSLTVNSILFDKNSRYDNIDRVNLYRVDGR